MWLKYNTKNNEKCLTFRYECTIINTWTAKCSPQQGVNKMEFIIMGLQGVVGVSIFLAGVFAAWAAFCLFLKGLFKIADWIF